MHVKWWHDKKLSRFTFNAKYLLEPKQLLQLIDVGDRCWMWHLKIISECHTFDRDAPFELKHLPFSRRILFFSSIDIWFFYVQSIPFRLHKLPYKLLGYKLNSQRRKEVSKLDTLSSQLPPEFQLDVPNYFLLILPLSLHPSNFYGVLFYRIDHKLFVLKNWNPALVAAILQLDQCWLIPQDKLQPRTNTAYLRL